MLKFLLIFIFFGEIYTEIHAVHLTKVLDILILDSRKNDPLIDILLSALNYYLLFHLFNVFESSF